MNRVLSFAFAGVLAVVAATSAHFAVATHASSPSFTHIFFVIDENHGYSQIIGSTSAPYINSLANQGSEATNYSAVSHPSLPNYLALTGGSTFGVTTDCSPSACPVNASNIADKIESSGRTWRAYMESMTTSCQLSDNSLYAQKHNPFIYYNDIRTSSRCSANDVPYTQLAGDLTKESTTPNFVWITPNLCDDMHGVGSTSGTPCSGMTGAQMVGFGDNWLKSNLATIFNSAAWKTTSSLLVLTWDEGSGNSNQVAWIALESPPAAHMTSPTPYTHYSTLKTEESIWGLPSLTSNDANSPAMSDLVGQAVQPTPSPSPTPVGSPSPSPTPNPGIAVVKSFGSAGGTASTSLSASSTTTAGHLLVVVTRVRNTATLTTVSGVSDTGGDVFKRAASVATGQQDSEIWYASNAAAVQSVTIKVSQPSALAMTVLEISGAKSPGVAVSAAGTSTTASTGSAVTAQPSAIAVADIGWNRSLSITAQGTGYALLTTQQSTVTRVNTGEQAAYEILTAPTTESYSATLSTSVAWAGVLVTFF